jgi:alkaline phosphatase
LKTILEYAEERGLSTGVISNSSIASATPAALYAHAYDRKMKGPIFAQILKPRLGDGVDVVIGPDRKGILEATAMMGLDMESSLKARGYGFYRTLLEIPAGRRRVVALLDNSDFDLGDATRRAIAILSQNPKGYFLMVESDLHTEKIIRGLERTVEFDRLIRDVAAQVSQTGTLILFTADHSYDFRIHDGHKDKPLFSDKERSLPSGDVKSLRLENIRRDDDHTGEEVLLTGLGPGAERIKGMISNTDIFHIMMQAYGWEAQPTVPQASLTARSACAQP